MINNIVNSSEEQLIQRQQCTTCFLSVVSKKGETKNLKCLLQHSSGDKVLIILHILYSVYLRWVLLNKILYKFDNACHWKYPSIFIRTIFLITSYLCYRENILLKYLFEDNITKCFRAQATESDKASSNHHATWATYPT